MYNFKFNGDKSFLISLFEDIIKRMEIFGKISTS